MTYRSIEHALESFREAAMAKPAAETTAEDHRLFRLLAEAARFLYAHGDEGREQFSTLVLDPSAEVRCWAAAQLLSEGRREAEVVLRELAGHGGLIGFEAEMTLQEYSSGSLASPFGITRE
jgi:hypothetical protein